MPEMDREYWWGVVNNGTINEYNNYKLRNTLVVTCASMIPTWT